MVPFTLITLFAASAMAAACPAPNGNSGSSYGSSSGSGSSSSSGSSSGSSSESSTDASGIPENWKWHVEHWGAGCEHTICNYQFNITVTDIEGVVSGAKAYCEGLFDYTNESPTYVPCKDLGGSSNSIAARLLQKNAKHPGPDEIDVSFFYVSSKYQ